MINFTKDPEKLKVLLDKGKNLEEILNKRNLSIQVFKVLENENQNPKWNSKQADYYGEYKFFVNNNTLNNNYPKDLIVLNYGFNVSIDFEPFETLKPQICKAINDSILEKDLNSFNITNFEDLNKETQDFIEFNILILNNVAIESDLTLHELLYFYILQNLKKQLYISNNIQTSVNYIKRIFKL